ncbi:MAG: hypothetical protein JWN34_1078, partial [Bryobacterales bacterium]|nr:hypothetical protein [Bryobacterales bacterium]
GPTGFLRIIASWENILRPGTRYEEQLQDYFALCVACHQATVGSFVPTDVDAKIRGVLWRATPDPDVLRPMLRFALQLHHWTEEGISVRKIRGVSGHNGEHWSVIAGALGRLLELGETEMAAEAQAAIEAEVDREQAIFDQVARERDAELDLLRVAMTLAHNQGDLKQGISFWKQKPETLPTMAYLLERGKFERAVRVYQETGMSAEGHRNYPLRAVRSLRRSPDTLLPLLPFLDDWGAKVATLEDNHEILHALVSGCVKLDNQNGYYRAIAGMRSVSQGNFDKAVSRMPNAAQRAVKSGEIPKLSAVPRASFEAMMRKRARTVVASFRDKG